MGSYGFPTFPCANDGCPKKAGVKGNKCFKCKSEVIGVATVSPTPISRQVDSYLLGKEEGRQRFSRRATK